MLASSDDVLKLLFVILFLFLLDPLFFLFLVQNLFLFMTLFPLDPLLLILLLSLLFQLSVQLLLLLRRKHNLRLFFFGLRLFVVKTMLLAEVKLKCLLDGHRLVLVRIVLVKHCCPLGDGFLDIKVVPVVLPVLGLAWHIIINMVDRYYVMGSEL